MVSSNLLLVVSLVGAHQSAGQIQPSQTDCAEVMLRGTGNTSAQVCLGEEQLRLAQAAPRESSERSRHMETAAGHYRKAVDLASDTGTKARVLNALAELYDPQHLARPGQMELVLRELIGILPGETEPLYRLAKVEEDQGLLEAAESTLQSARHLQPKEVEPYRRLAQFYARWSTAIYSAKATEKSPESSSSPAEPDANGVYKVGGGVGPPHREGTPEYPKEAQVAGIEGAVVAEIVINETGVVTEARVVRSIPLLDEAALEAVRQWRFDPTIVNGRAVPVRMEVTVNFVTKMAPKRKP